MEAEGVSRVPARPGPSPAASSPRRRPRRVRRGFTLIEAALATVIVGVGVLAMVSAQQAFHRKNRFSTHASTATWLANEMREMTFTLPRHDPVTGRSYWGPEPGELSIEDFDDLDDFDGAAGTGLVFSAELGNGPVNARRELIANMPGWAQTITVHNVDPHDIDAPPGSVADGTTSMMRVEVLVTYQGPGALEPEEMVRVSWISPE